MPAWLVHPLPLLAIALTAINDHILKGSGVAPAWLTGKLSDFAGLFFFPLAVAAVLRARQPTPRTLVVVVSGALFAAFKLSPAACALIAPVATVTSDATDLMALAMLPLAWWWMARWRPSARWDAPAWSRTVAVGAAALTSAATSPSYDPYFYRPLPMWSAVGKTQQSLGCADVDLWVSQSGRLGIGLTLMFVGHGDVPCPLVLNRVALIAGAEAEHAASGLPQRVDIDTTHAVYRYVAIPFDNAAAWRGHDHIGVVRADVTMPEGEHPLRFDVVYAQAPPPAWGTYGRISPNVLITGTSDAGLSLVARVYPITPSRLSKIELVGDDGPIATQRLDLTVDGTNRVEKEVPIFLPLDEAKREQARRQRHLRLRVTIEGGDPAAGTFEVKVYVPERERRP